MSALAESAENPSSNSIDASVYKKKYTGSIQQGNRKSPCRFIKLNENEATIAVEESFDIGRVAVCNISELEIEIACFIAWEDSLVVGVKFIGSIRDVLYGERQKSLSDALTTTRARAIELVIGLISVVIGALGIVYVAIQTTEIRKQNRMQTEEIQLQTIQTKLQNVLQVEDSERFINGLLLRDTKIAKLLMKDLNDNQIQSVLLAHIFLQEWEKMFRLRQECLIEKNLWRSYKDKIRQLQTTGLLSSILEHPEQLSGYHPDFVKFMAGVEKPFDCDRSSNAPRS